MQKKQIQPQFLHLTDSQNKDQIEKKLEDILKIIDIREGELSLELREGLQDTPKRYTKFLTEFMNPDPFNMSTFESEDYDEMIVVKDIPFYSLCEHHLAPFFGTGAIAYIPNPETKRIVGLSKLPRILDYFARRPQNQERITQQVASFVQEHLNPLGVAVSLTARHMCMEMRGIKKSGAQTQTNKFIGVFKEDSIVRHEFLNSLKI